MLFCLSVHIISDKVVLKMGFKRLEKEFGRTLQNIIKESNDFEKEYIQARKEIEEHKREMAERRKHFRLIRNK